MRKLDLFLTLPLMTAFYALPVAHAQKEFGTMRIVQDEKPPSHMAVPSPTPCYFEWLGPNIIRICPGGIITEIPATVDHYDEWWRLHVLTNEWEMTQAKRHSLGRA